jgi:hypothetical protein
VVGLGVTGAGVTLDAALRGLSVVAVDAHDLPSAPPGGVPSWSTVDCGTSRRASSASPTRARWNAAS